MENFQNLIEEVSELKKQLNFKMGEECLYRGQDNSEYVLTPSIFRKKAVYSRHMEESIFHEFRCKGLNIYQNLTSDWDILFFMQHYDCKTRLLDWTDNFGSALFFALYNREESNDAAIYLLNPYALNDYKNRMSPRYRDFYDPENLNYNGQYSYSKMIKDNSNGDFKKAKIWWDYPLAIYPQRRSDRLAFQNGYFTIQGCDLTPLDKQISKDENIWKKIIIPKEIVELFGINSFTIYPDFTGLSKFLNKKYNQ